MTTTITQTTRKNEAEEIMRRLDGVDGRVGRKAYTVGDIGFDNFAGWAEAAAHTQDPDEARNILFFGFQPLYDALIDERVSPDKRETAVAALNKIIEEGTQFLGAYYTGEPEVTVINALGKELTPHMDELRRTPFKTKFRNVDYNGITPRNIVSFLRQFLENAQDGKLGIPDYVVGIACGPSEIAMPLSYLTGAGLGFMRRSHRRGDDAPRIVAEHESEIEQGVTGKNVVVFEDYVCSGASLRRVMEATRDLGPASLHGTSVNSDTGMYGLKTLVHNKKFQLHALK